jgi:hypothetical protein
MDAAALVIVGLLLVAFGSWRVMAGLYQLELIALRVPGHDLFTRFVPRWMRGSDTFDGVFDVIGGLVFIVAGVSVMSAA